LIHPTTLIFAVITALLLAIPQSANSTEEILSFDSQVVVNQQGDLLVTERITVKAEGKQIKRGIVRRLPVEYQRKHSLSTLLSKKKPSTAEAEKFVVKEVFVDGRKSYDWYIDQRAYGEYVKFYDFFLGTLEQTKVRISVTYQRANTNDEYDRHTFEEELTPYALQRGLYVDFIEGYRKQNIFSHYLNRLYHANFFTLNDRQELQIHSVLRDGRSSSWFVKEEHGHKVIYIGSRNVYLEPGEYEYAITYRYNKQSWRESDQDKISWNVTGNGWPFSILKASTTIQFPDNIPSSEVEVDAFTGYFGQTQKAFQIVEFSDTSVTVSTSEILSPKQGLTVDLAWPKGSINQLSTGSRYLNTVLMNKGLFALLTAWLGLFMVYWRTWSKYGRDPVLKEAIPRYQAPNNESPAVMRFVNNDGEYDERVFASALISLASKGKLKIVQDGRHSFKLQKLEEHSYQNFSGDEGALFSKLFSKHDIIDPSKSTHAEKLFRAQEAHIRFLNFRHKPENYLEKHSGRRFGLGFLQTIIWFATLVFSFSQQTFDGGFFLMFTIAYFFLCRFANQLVERRTKRGAVWVPQMEGFFQYLVMAENDELRAVHPLKKTPDVYQEYLPYAVALDIEDVWGETFSDVLDRSARNGLAAIFGSAETDFSKYTEALSDNLERKIGTSRKKIQRQQAKARKARASSYRSSSSGGSSSSSWGGSSSSGGGSSGGGSSGGGSGGGGGGGW